MFNLKEFRAEKDETFAGHPRSPLTPAENRLKVAIRAGKKIFHEEDVAA